MTFGNFAYHYIDWWHAEINQEGEDPSAFLPGTDIPEYFTHPGLFKNKAVNLGFTIGLNNYWNVTLSQLISERCMEWQGPVDEDGNSLTVHHRTECSSSDFFDGDNQIAFGGVLGDTRINFRYLLKNQMKGPGDRLFFGMGLDIPSSNVITESPWKKSDHDGDDGCESNPSLDCNGIDESGDFTGFSSPHRYSPHRHFYLSDGVYKMNLELQFFKKRIQFPVFWGGTLSFNFPLNDSKYGFRPSKRYELSLMAMSSSMPFQKIKLGKFSLSSIGPTLTIGYASRSRWEDEGETPNSKSILYVPGINILISSENGGGFGINITRGFEHYMNENPSDIKEKTNIYGISISYRKVLDKRIDWLW